MHKLATQAEDTAIVGMKNSILVTARKYRALIVTVSILVLLVAGLTYVLVQRYAASHVKFVSINGKMYYTSDFSDYMSLKMGDISPKLLNSTEVFQFYLHDFVRYNLIYQDARGGGSSIPPVADSEVRDALEGNASKADTVRILSNPQVFNSFLGITYQDSVIHGYMVDNFYRAITISPAEIIQEYDRVKKEFDNYPIRHILGIVTDNSSLQQEILEELKEYDFEEVARRYGERYSDVFLQEGFLLEGSIPQEIIPADEMSQGETHLYDQGGVHHIYQVLGVYRNSRNFIPLDLLRDSIGKYLYHQKVNSYVDDYIEILYTTTDIHYYIPNGTVINTIMTP